MKNTKYAWIYSPSGDELALREYLNCLASEGWELEAPNGNGIICYLAKFRRTSRSELRYDVEPRGFCTEEELQAKVELRAAEGWEPVCTMNGVNIYSSMPCRSPQFSDSWCDNGKSSSVFLGISILAYLLSSAFAVLWNHLHPVWYLSHLDAYLHLTVIPFAVVSISLAVWSLLRFVHSAEQPAQPKLFTLRRIMLGSLVLWRWLLICSILFTFLPLLWALGVILGVILLHLLLQFDELLCTGCALLLTIVLVAAMPVQDASNISGLPWRSSGTNILTAEQLNLAEGALIYADMEENGSFLVQCVSYSEKREGIRIESRVYTCLTERLTKQVEADLRERFPSYTVYRSGRKTAAVWTSASLTAEEIEKAIAEQIT